MPLQILVDPHAPQKALLAQAAEVLHKGGVVLHPTETVYGLAARWDSEAALEKVSRIKGRPPQQPYSIMVHEVDTIPELLGWHSVLLQRLLETFFPGPVTLLLPRRKRLAPKYWNRFPYLGFRMPEHRISRELTRLTGTPLITTSANKSGAAPLASLGETSPELRRSVDCVIDGGPCPLRIPSTIVKVDLSPPRYTIVREGALPAAEVKKLFRRVINLASWK